MWIIAPESQTKLWIFLSPWAMQKFMLLVEDLQRSVLSENHPPQPPYDRPTPGKIFTFSEFWHAIMLQLGNKEDHGTTQRTDKWWLLARVAMARSKKQLKDENLVLNSFIASAVQELNLLFHTNCAAGLCTPTSTLPGRCAYWGDRWRSIRWVSFQTNWTEFPKNP